MNNKTSLVAKIMLTVFSLSVVRAQAANWYVDPVNGNDDDNDGKAADRAKRTLSVALACAKSYDTIWALPGYYTNGTQSVTGSTRLFRGVVNESVTLRSTAGAERTFIIGAPASSPDANGLGADAVSCLKLSGGAKVFGFTLTGGRSTAGGGGAGINGSGVVWGDLVCDCVISNNVAYRGGGVQGVDFLLRNRFVNNRATDYGTGAAADQPRTVVNCVFEGGCWDSSTRGTVYAPNGGNIGQNVPLKIVNCTFVTGRPESSTAKSLNVYNSLLLDGSQKGCSYHNCYFAKDWSTDANSEADADCRLYTAAELALDDEYRPIKGNKAIGAGDWTTYTNEFAKINAVSDKEMERSLEVLRGPRVMLGSLDIGAGEYDPTADFATALGDAAITLTNVTSGVLAAADGTPVISDGESLEVLWALNGANAGWFVRAGVVGEGVLSVFEDDSGTASWVLTEASGTTVLSGTASSGLKKLRFAFSGAGTGRLMACSDKATVSVTDASGGLIVEGLADGKVPVGGAFSIRRNFAATKFCRGFYVNGEYVDFNEHPDDWIWKMTVMDPFAPIVISADCPVHAEYYVDPVHGNDGNDGLTPYPAHAKATLAGALSVARAHETVTALPGHYTNETQTSGAQLFRGVVGESVTLRSAEGAEKTVVVGGDGISGIKIVRDGIVRGLTITGCRATGNGAALQGDRGWNACVFDCVISNNVAARGGGASEVDNLYRCRFIDNQATDYGTGAAVNDARNIVNCVFDGKVWDANTRGIVYKNNSATKILNCTFVHGCPDCATAKSLHVYDSILLDGSAKGCSYHNCLFTKDWTTDKNSEADAATRQVSEADLQLDGSFRPRKGSAAIDAGSDSDYESQFPVVSGIDTATERGLEVCRGQRVYGASIDVGAGEHDIRPELSRALGNPARISVSEATRDIVLSSPKGVVLSNGTMTVEWVDSQRVPLEEERHFHFSARVEGGGTLLISLDGVPFASLSASDGLKELEFPGTGAKHVLTFSYVAPAADDAGAWLGDFTVPRGMCLILR